MNRILDWCLFVVFLAVITVLLGPTAVGGATSYVIVDGRSMEPTYQHGDLIIAREADEYAVGDVITYDAPVGRTFRVIHRITEVTDEGYVTQGDNRDEADGWTVPFDAVHGSTSLRIPMGGTAAVFLRQPPTLIALAAGWATLSYLTRRSRREDATEEATVDRSRETPRLSRAARRAELRIRRTRRAGDLLLFATTAAVGLGAGIFVANAAWLAVDGGVLQAFTIDDLPVAPDPEPEPDPTGTDVTVGWWLFAVDGTVVTGGGDPHATEVVTTDLDGAYTVDPRSPLVLDEGARYLEVACDATTLAVVPTADRYGSGAHVAGDVDAPTHAVCLQARPLVITWYDINPGDQVRAEATAPAHIDPDGTYDVALGPPGGFGGQDYDEKDCATFAGLPPADAYGSGTDLSAGDTLTHAVCLQQRTGGGSGGGSGGGKP